MSEAYVDGMLVAYAISRLFINWKIKISIVVVCSTKLSYLGMMVKYMF